jgi:hypothetical protein
VSDDEEVIGDVDPEDEWDDIDPFRVRLEILERVLDDLSERRDERFRARLEDALRLIGKLVREHQEDTVRLERIRESLEALS